MTYEFEGKTEKDAIEKAVAELNLNADQFDVEILETQKKSLFKSGHVKIRVIVDDEDSGKKSDENDASRPVSGKLIPQDEFEQKLVDFIRNIIERMGYSASVDVFFREDKKIGIRLDSDSSSILIGRKGKNLDALQLLANVYAGHIGREDVRVILDTENYRVRREENLVHLAYTSADKVRSTRLSVLLEPMNPYDRRIIHTTLNDISDIETKSEGEGLFKQVRIMLKSY
ncbi:MAG: protein jag [Treponema sp.]|nr:protein jag [Treponema sp.]MBR6913697.1 protein jag [Treponema sp.]